VSIYEPMSPYTIFIGYLDDIMFHAFFNMNLPTIIVDSTPFIKYKNKKFQVPYEPHRKLADIFRTIFKTIFSIP